MDQFVQFKSETCNGRIEYMGRTDIKIVGKLEDSVSDKRIFYIAASPADHRSTYTGSGLPFANQVQAFESTPNIGVVELSSDNTFEIELMTPNSYIVGLGSVVVPPTLYLEYLDGERKVRRVQIKVSNGIPYRTMTYPMVPRPRSSVDFYDTQFYLPVRSQEQILLDSAYPRTNQMPDSHWGAKPPL